MNFGIIQFLCIELLPCIFPPALCYVFPGWCSQCCSMLDCITQARVFSENHQKKDSLSTFSVSDWVSTCWRTAVGFKDKGVAKSCYDCEVLELTIDWISRAHHMHNTLHNTTHIDNTMTLHNVTMISRSCPCILLCSVLVPASARWNGCFMHTW